MLNSYQFSAAKDLSETKAMQELVHSAASFKEFKEKAGEITDINNDQWLRVEMDVCKRNTIMGENFRKMEETKDLYPYWIYKTEEDGHVRPEHAALEGLVFRIGDPEGDSVHPSCAWNCRCHSEPVDDRYLKEENKQVSKGSDFLTENDPKTNKPYVDKDFRFNPGKQGAMPNDSSYSEVLSSANKGNVDLFNMTEPLIKDAQTIYDELYAKIDTKYQELLEKYESADDKFKKTDEFRKLESETLGTKKFRHRILNMDVENNAENFEKIKKFTNFKGTPQQLFGDGNIIASEISIEKEKLISSILTEDGYLQRTFDIKAKSVNMDEFYLNPLIKKGTGKGTEMFSSQVNEFYKLGFKKLITEAGDAKGMNGYYTWARLGYDITDKKELSIFKSLIKASGEKEFKNITSLQELMSTKKGREFWRENGYHFTGTFDLTRDSNSRNILERYITKK
jgi:hypothetical protein